MPALSAALVVASLRYLWRRNVWQLRPGVSYPQRPHNERKRPRMMRRRSRSARVTIGITNTRPGLRNNGYMLEAGGHVPAQKFKIATSLPSIDGFLNGPYIRQRNERERGDFSPHTALLKNRPAPMLCGSITAELYKTCLPIAIKKARPRCIRPEAARRMGNHAETAFEDHEHDYFGTIK